jgi:hypothetical protein
MAISKPLDLVRFISDVPVLNDGTIPINTLDETPLYYSYMYEPVYSLSAIARITQGVLKNGKIEVVNIPLDPNTIVSKAYNSDLASYAPNIYLLLQAVVLESFALLYHIETDSINLQYVSHKDIQKIKTNIGYIADYFGSEDKYYSLIETMRIMNISLGYLENQIDVIMNDKGVR